MEKQELLKIQQLSSNIGRFIRYWGFRKIHGEIWTLIYLSKEPISGAELVKLLNVSKALVSPAIKELEAEGLIKQVKSENAKTKRFEAEENVGKIIQGVLNRREKPMIEKVLLSYQDLIELSGVEKTLNFDRLQKMGIMVQLAQVSLQGLIELELFEPEQTAIK